MSAHRPHSGEHHSPDELLREAKIDGSPGTIDSLAGLLAAAAAPARGCELDGEDGAVAAFRAARDASAPARAPELPAVPSPRRSLLARLRTTKSAALALAVTIAGGAGVAVAAGTGNLPGPLGGGHGRPSATVKPDVTTPDAPSTAPAKRTGPKAMPTQKPPSSSAKSADTGPKGSVVQLCSAYAKANEHALDSAAFSRLVQEAGGADKVAAYCATHLGKSQRNPTPGKPAPATTPPTAATNAATKASGDGQNPATDVASDTPATASSKSKKAKKDQAGY